MRSIRHVAEKSFSKLAHQTQGLLQKGSATYNMKGGGLDSSRIAHLSLDELAEETKNSEINDKRNFESSEVVNKWRRENEKIKSFIYKMNIGKKAKIWK